MASLPATLNGRPTKEWKHLITLAGFRIMSEGLDNSQLAPDAKGCVSEEHVAEWFADAPRFVQPRPRCPCGDLSAFAGIGVRIAQRLGTQFDRKRNIRGQRLQ